LLGHACAATSKSAVTGYRHDPGQSGNGPHENHVRQPRGDPLIHLLQAEQSDQKRPRGAHELRGADSPAALTSDVHRMIHEQRLAAESTTTHLERRRDERAPLPAEMTLRWLHDPETLIRVQVRDVSERGYRLHTRLPIRLGATGIAVRLLPSGEPLDHVVVVMRIHRQDDGTYDVGLQRI